MSAVLKQVRKRDGRVVPFDRTRIAEAIFRAAKAVGGKRKDTAGKLASQAESALAKKFTRRVPGIEDIQDVVEKVLIEAGHAKTAKAYILYRDKRARLRQFLTVHKEVKGGNNTTDLSLLVTAPSKYEVLAWDKSKIAEALVREAQVPLDFADKIAREVEEKILALGLKKLSTSMIREFVDMELINRGFNGRLKSQQVIGMPVYDLRELIFSKSQENSNITANNPEAINLSIAENTIKQYMLQEIFSEDVGIAHLTGLVHVHDLGYPRVYCSSHSLEYLKKYGLVLDNLGTASAPPKHARTLTGHLNTFLASMQAYYAGALGIGFLNIFYAPFLQGMSYDEMKQEAQYLIFSGSQNAFSRGGQSLFLDSNIHLGIPDYLKDVEAIGPGGKYMGKAYRDFEKESQMFARALMEVWKEGDREGHPFSFPKMDLHINNETFSDPKQYELFKFACEVASFNGSPYFFFDRGDGATLSQCCRLRTKVTDPEMLKHPETIRFCGFQNVTINLPQCAYRAGKENITKVFEEVDKAMEIAMKAHVEKKRFIAKLMSGPGTPLWQIGKNACDGKPYVDLEKSTYIIGLIGLNECVQYLIGKQLHEGEEAFRLGMKIISSMYLKTLEFKRKYGLNIALEDSPAESASRRLTKVDLREFPQSKEVVKGDIKKDSYYYTNSIHYAANAPIGFLDRIIGQSKFHPIIESGAIIHAFVGEARPSPESIENLVRKTWENTQCGQLTISPEFTICNDCAKVGRGLTDTCGSCGSANVYGLTRIVGYFSKVHCWNKSKLGELKDRQKAVQHYQFA